MKKRTFFYSFIVFVGLLAMIVLGGISYAKNNSVLNESEEVFFGKYTFAREMVLGSGEVYSFFESGDEHFRYYHDDEGYVLIRDIENNVLTYATLVDGILTKTFVGFSASEEEKASILRVRAVDIDFQKNPDLVSKIDRASPYGGKVYLSQNEEDVEYVEQLPLLSNTSEKRTITNLVILIKFNQTSQQEVESAITSFDPYFNGSVTSLKNYYETITYGEVTINSIVPRTSTNEVYVHNGGDRSYYNIEDSNTSRRRTRESELLSGAINGAKDKFDLAGKNLDINSDSFIDSVSFLICGDNSDTWGGLLWPHSWNFDVISPSSPSYIAGIKVGDYSFNFSTSINVGVLCHETGHVLGAPDLYHYNYDFVPVGKWDLMSSNTEMPQYMLTYTRDKYIGGIKEGQTVDILGTGVYSLSPVSTSTSNTDVLAYKIRLASRPNEYFMIEYRNPNISARYDSTLPRNGLILYRVRESSGQTSVGNRDAKFQSGAYPDEVYVFRPLITMNPKGSSSAIYSASLVDVDKANLSPVNPNFRSIGKPYDITKYNYNNIFYSDGTNSQIVIEALSISSESLQFRVALPDEVIVIPEDAFSSKISVDSAKYYNGDWAGVECSLKFEDEINLSYLANVRVELYSSSNELISTNNLNLGDFKWKYTEGIRLFECPFVARDKGKIISSSFYLGGLLSSSPPSKVKVIAIDAEGKEKNIAEANISGGAYAWEDILNADQETLASVFAGSKISVAIDKQGEVFASGSTDEGIWAVKGEEDVLMVALGRKHILVLKKNMTVKSYGESFYGEREVTGWNNVTQVTAGDYTSYGLLTDGSVVAAGLNSDYQLQIGGWENIIEIAAGAKHVVGLSSDGRVYAAGDNSLGQCNVSEITNAKAIAAGDSFTFILRTSGEISIIGNFPYSPDLSTFSNITTISAGSRHILAIKEDGRVVAAGDNSSEQCNTTGLYDIVALDGGEYHSIFMREDGVVEYRGYGNSQYETNTPLPNLKYDAGSYINPVAVNTPFIEGGGSSIPKGEQRTISVNITPSNATYQRVVYTSSNENIVKVHMLSSGTGIKEAKIEGITVGSATITARVNGSNQTSSIKITVYEEKALTGIAIERVSSPVKITKTKSLKLNYSLIPIDATNVGGATPSFVSSHPSIASVGAGDGVVNGIAEGSAFITISITVGGQTFTDTCEIVVVDSTPVLELTQAETPIKVRQNGKIDLALITMKVTIGGDPTFTLPITENMLSSHDTSTLGSKTVNVTYLGVSKQITIEVFRYVAKIEFVTLPKTQYKYNEELSYANGKIKATYSNQTSQEYSINQVSGYNSKKLGTQTLTVEFSDPEFGNSLTLPYDVTVLDYVQSVSYQPRQTIYTFGSIFNPTEQLNLKMGSGENKYEDFDSPNIKVSGYDGNIRGVHKVSVEYTDRANEDNVLNASPVIIEVRMIGSFSYEGRDTQDYHHYFEVERDLTLKVYFDQGLGNRIEITPSSSDLWYELVNFDKSLKYIEGNSSTQQTVTYKCFTRYSKLTDGVISVEASSEFADFNISVRGLEPVSSWQIVKKIGLDNYVPVSEEEILGYEYSSNPSEDPSPLDLRIKKTFFTGKTEIALPMEALYDKELVDVVQPYTARYLDTYKQVNIKITDIPKYIYDIPDQVFSYGDPFSLTTYIHMEKRGKTPLYPQSYSIEFKNSDNSYNNITNFSQRLGVQTVKITYVFGSLSLSKSFSLEVVDVYQDIEMIETPKSIYKYGEAFDPSDALFRLHMKSGNAIDENYDQTKYSHSEFNPENLSPSGQMIVIYYRPEGVVLRSFTINCKVENYVKNLQVTPTKTAYKYGEPLEVEVRAIYADGTNTRVNENSYIHSYNSNEIGRQEVIFGYLEGSAMLVVHVSDVVKNISINTQGAKKIYGYGEALDFMGVSVTLKYESQNESTITGEQIGTELKITYNPVKVGAQAVQVEGYVGGAKTSFTVEVRGEDASVMKASDINGISLKLQDRVVAAKTVGASLSDLDSMFTYANYLEKSLVDKNGTYLNPLSTRSLRTGDRVIFTNAMGYKVYDFEVHVFGDSNGDGKVSQSDLESMAQRILNGENKKYIMDYNGDGKSTLTDIVLFARFINGN